MNAACHAGSARPFALAPAPAGLPGRVLRRAAGLFEAIGLWLWRANYRGELRQLTDHQLRDMGLDRDQVSHEATKPFWRA